MSMANEIGASVKSYKSALKAFGIVNVYFILSGPLTIYIIHILNNPNGAVEKVLASYAEDTHVPAYLLYFSAALTTVNGVLGLFSVHFDIPILLDSHEGFTFVSLGLPLIAVVAGSLVPTRPSNSNYANVFQAETYHLLHHRKFSSICQGDHTWNHIQEVARCCGVLGPRDWLFSSVQAIPPSCCNSKFSGYKTCVELVAGSQNWTFQRIAAEIFPLLWHGNCVDTFQDLLAKRKFIWTIFPLCLMLVKSFIMAYSALLVDFIRNYTEYMSKRQPKEPLREITEALKRQQAELKIIPSTTSLEENLEKTMKMRRQFNRDSES